MKKPAKDYLISFLEIYLYAAMYIVVNFMLKWLRIFKKINQIN